MKKSLTRSMFLATVFGVSFCLLIFSLANAKPNQQLNFTGPFTNTTYSLSGEVKIAITFNTDNSVSGYINFTQYPGVTTLCGAGNFTGNRQGNQVDFTFVSNDPDPGCGFDVGLIFRVIVTLSQNDTIMTGDYFINNGQRGILRAATEVWGSLDALKNIYAARKNTNSAAYAHQFYCIASKSCQEYNTHGVKGWSSGFVKYLFDYQAAHNEGKKGLDVVCPNAYNDWQCFKAAAGVHGINELQPIFFSYCDLYGGKTPAEYQAFETQWTNDHEAFLNQAFDQCFDEVFSAGELPLSPGTDLRDSYKTIAQHFRNTAQVWCRFKTGNLLQDAKSTQSETLASNFPVFPTPLTKKELYSVAIDSSTTLKVSSGERFFLPVGSSLQLTVTKTNPDGSVVDLTSSLAGTQYSLDLGVDKSIATVTSNGLLTILGTTSPITAEQQVLYVVVRNKSDLGIGQFAITDSDTDHDLIVNSVELKNGLDPNVSNNLNSDIDHDGVSDFYETIRGTLPTSADSDGDKFDDAFEIRAGSDPLDPNCTPITGCVSHIFLPVVDR